jgi:hypothetical protein
MEKKYFVETRTAWILLGLFGLGVILLLIGLNAQASTIEFTNSTYNEIITVTGDSSDIMPEIYAADQITPRTLEHRINVTSTDAGWGVSLSQNISRHGDKKLAGGWTNPSAFTAFVYDMWAARGRIYMYGLNETGELKSSAYIYTSTSQDLAQTYFEDNGTYYFNRKIPCYQYNKSKVNYIVGTNFSYIINQTFYGIVWHQGDRSYYIEDAQLILGDGTTWSNITFNNGMLEFDTVNRGLLVGYTWYDVMHIKNKCNVIIQNYTLRFSNDFLTNNYQCIRNEGTLTMIDCTIIINDTTEGIGIASSDFDKDVTLIRCTLNGVQLSKGNLYLKDVATYNVYDNSQFNNNSIIYWDNTFHNGTTYTLYLPWIKCSPNNILFTRSNYAIFLWSNFTIYNAVWKDNSYIFFGVINKSLDIKLRNCESDSWLPYGSCYDEGVQRQYSFDVQVVDNQEPIEDATIELLTKDNEQVFELTTDAQGKITQQWVNHSTIKWKTYTYTPHTIRVSHPDYDTIEFPLNVSEAINLTIDLSQQVGYYQYGYMGNDALLIANPNPANNSIITYNASGINTTIDVWYDNFTTGEKTWNNYVNLTFYWYDPVSLDWEFYGNLTLSENGTYGILESENFTNQTLGTVIQIKYNATGGGHGGDELHYAEIRTQWSIKGIVVTQMGESLAKSIVLGFTFFPLAYMMGIAQKKKKRKEL